MRKTAIFLFILFVSIFTFVFPCSGPSVAVTAGGQSIDYLGIIESVNMTAIQQHVQFFSGLGTRAIGYPGSQAAGQYIYDKFVEYGLENVSFQEFPVVEAVDHGANLTILSTRQVVKLYPCKPNLVASSTTPPEGLTGRLIYVGDGYLSDFDGEEVEGSIVVMNWYGDENWLNAAKLGAKAVIFIPPKLVFPTPTPLYTATGGKSVNVPVQFPRFYAPDAESLLDYLHENVRIKADTRWERLMGRNVLGFVKGVKDPNVIILLTSYYDSGGIVPSLAPGAQEACGISALLEVAKYFEENKPKYTVMFVAYSGHHQSVLGSIEFANDYIRRYDPAKRSIGNNIYIQFNLDFSTGSDAIFITAHTPIWPGTGCCDMDPAWKPVPTYLEGVLEEMNQQRPGGRVYEGNVIVTDYSSGPRGYYPFITKTGAHSSFVYFLYDHWPILSLGPTECGDRMGVSHGVAGYTITTAHDPRPFYGRPYDTLREVDFDNLQKQLELTYCLLSSMLYMDDLKERFIEARLVKNQDPDLSDVAWFSIRGKIVTWNESRAWYDPVPNAIVYAWMPSAPMIYRFALSDEEGDFVFRGGFRRNRVYQITAYKVNSSTGAVTYAPDQGVHRYPTLASPYAGPTDVGYIAVFKASTIVIFDSMDPGSLSFPSGVGEETTSQGYFGLLTYSLYESETFVVPERWGYLGTTTGKSYLFDAQGLSRPLFRFYLTSVLAAPPDTSVILVARWAGERYPAFFLANCSENYPAGYGYTLKPGQQIRIPYTSLSFAEDLYWANEWSYDKLLKFAGRQTGGYQLEEHQRVRDLIDESYKALEDYKYSKWFLYATTAWSIARDVYLYIRPTIEDAAYVVPFFAVLLIPFVFLLEKLLFRFTGVKRIISFIAIFIGTLAALFLLHPGFSLAANPMMVVVSISIVILILPTVLIMFGRASAFIEALRLRILGRHATEISRGSEVVHAFSTGVENMRKRKLRSALVLTSMIFMVAALVSFSSITAIKGPTTRSVLVTPLYDGIYIHRLQWGQGEPDIGQPILDYLKAGYEDRAIICPRAWKYTLWPTLIDGPSFKATCGENITRAYILWGLTPQEKEISHIDGLLRHGRWFEPYDRRTCILNEEQVEELGIDPKSVDVGPVNVTIEGIPFYLIGVISSDYQMFKEMDGEIITPLKLDIFGPNPWDQHVSADYLFIVKFEDAILLGGSVASVSIKFKDVSTAPSAIEEVTEKLTTIPIWSSVEGETKLHSRGLQVSVLGLQFQMVPIAIVVLSIFNMLLGSVHERKKEISIYAFVGLSPLNVAMIFLAEIVVYALIGAMMGYLLGLFMCQTITAYLPGALTLNYSSTWVTTSVLSAMGTVLVSSIYPLYLAARLVTPSLKRVWEITTKPIGDTWEIPLPFHATTEEELNGIISYLDEYIEPHMGEAAPQFSVRSLHFESGELRGSPFKGLAMELRLPPYDLGVVQSTEVRGLEMKERWQFRAVLKRLDGALDDWIKLNRDFVDHLRKQLLMWRALSIEEKDAYIRKFDEVRARLRG